MCEKIIKDCRITTEATNGASKFQLKGLQIDKLGANGTLKTFQDRKYMIHLKHVIA